jgi:hypothetical protein
MTFSAISDKSTPLTNGTAAQSPTAVNNTDSDQERSQQSSTISPVPADEEVTSQTSLSNAPFLADEALDFSGVPLKTASKKMVRFDCVASSANDDCVRRNGLTGEQDDQDHTEEELEHQGNDSSRSQDCSIPKTRSKRSLQQAQVLLQRVSRGSNARRRKSPPPANMTALECIKLQLDRMEAKIQKSAVLELALLNQSKTIREQRTAYQRRYEKMARDYGELVQAAHPDQKHVVQSSMPHELPPTFPGNRATMKST